MAPVTGPIDILAPPVWRTPKGARRRPPLWLDEDALSWALLGSLGDRVL
jgi:hypothetical protein